MAANKNEWNAPWWVAAGMAFSISAGLAGRPGGLFSWWQPLALTVVAAFALVLVGWRRPVAIPACVLIGLSLVGCGSFVAWVTARGWGKYPLWVMAAGAVVVTVASLRLPTVGTLSDWIVDERDPGDPRPRIVRDREAKLVSGSKRNVVVDRVEPWKEAPKNGERIYLTLPDGCTVDDLRGCIPQIQAALRLPTSCVASVLDGEHHQGEAIVDVMWRDCFGDDSPPDIDTTPASVNDRFPIGRNARGVLRYLCLRIESMIVGGAPGSGKTTLLRRIIMFLGRCVDAFICVVDMNGGGVAEPFVTPHFEGKAKQPLVGWVATNPFEAAVMLAGIREILKARKQSRECIDLKRQHNTNVLPVSARKPAIIVIGDEGAEVEELPGLLGLLVSQGITKIAEIGRAEAGRVIHSVLRGVATAIDKTLRVNARLRLCARMNEHGEYTHILDEYPPRVRMRHKGMFWAGISAVAEEHDDGDEVPTLELLRGTDVTPDMMERHTIACADLRPDLDDEAKQVLANLTLWDVLGRDPDEVDREIVNHPAMQAVERREAFTGRWDRYQAEISDASYGQPPAPGANPYDLDLPELDDADEEPSGDEQDDGEADDTDDEAQDAAESDDGAGSTGPASAREAIEQLMRELHPRVLKSREIGEELLKRGTRVSRQTRQNQLKALTRALVLERAGQAAGGYRYRPQVGDGKVPTQSVPSPHTQRLMPKPKASGPIYRPGQRDEDDDYADEVYSTITGESTGDCLAKRWD